jgi:uncharacterized membrane protein YfcA
LIPDLVWLIAAGFAGGILAGLLGIGGGIIYVLILPYALEQAGIPLEYLAPFTIANSIFGVLFASLTTNYLNIRHDDFYFRESLWVGIPGAVCSLLILKMIVTRPWYSVTYFNILLILFLGYMLFSLFRKGNQKINKDSEAYRPSTMSLAGSVGGSLSALTGLGGGAAVVPILCTQLQMRIKKARSISLAMIFMTSFALTIFNLNADPGIQSLPYQMGYIYLPAALPLTGGVLLGSPFGSKLGRVLGDQTIKILFGIFILIVILEKSWQLL